MASAGSAADVARSRRAELKPAYSMLKPASEGPMKAAIELPSEKVAKFFVRSAAPSEPTRTCTETWKKMAARPMRVEQKKRMGSDEKSAGAESESAMVAPPRSIG